MAPTVLGHSCWQPQLPPPFKFEMLSFSLSNMTSNKQDVIVPMVFPSAKAFRRWEGYQKYTTPNHHLFHLYVSRENRLHKNNYCCWQNRIQYDVEAVNNLDGFHSGNSSDNISMSKPYVQKTYHLKLGRWLHIQIYLSLHCNCAVLILQYITVTYPYRNTKQLNHLNQVPLMKG